MLMCTHVMSGKANVKSLKKDNNPRVGTRGLLFRMNGFGRLMSFESFPGLCPKAP